MSALQYQLARIALVLLSSAPCAVAAAPIQPFEAQVQPGEDAFVRSGPGIAHHYPTMKLKAGEVVRVIRKDPGGWYMIDPPPGSFSWVIAKYVQRNGNQGLITENGVVVRVGAFNSTQRDVEQVRLNKGDTVEILGEQVLDSDRSRDLWFKIRPPRGEHRWIKGSHLVELAGDGTPKVIQKQPPVKPDAPAPSVEPPPEPSIAATAKKPVISEQSPAISRDPRAGGLEDAPLFGVAPGRKNHDPFADEPYHGPAPKSESATIREDLAILDEELRQILMKSVREWNMDQQLEDLQALRDMTNDLALQADIDRRVEKVRQIERIHRDALALAKPSSERVSLKSSTPGPSQESGPVDPAGPANLGGTVANSASNGSFGNGSTATAPPRSGASSRFEGAGIVHRLPQAAPGLPKYVIAAPDRRILCYLDPAQGVDLERFLGQPVGVNGQRYYEPRLRNDRMLVQRITPVRLAQ